MLLQLFFTHLKEKERIDCGENKKKTYLTYTSAPARVAEFHYTVDGLDNNSTEIPVKLFATTKAADTIKENNGSFIDGAYVLESYKVCNDSEVTVRCNVYLNSIKNDNRIIAYTSTGKNDKNTVKELSDILRSKAGTKDYPNEVSDFTAAQVSEVFSSYKTADTILQPNESTYVYTIFWCEHDSVFPSTKSYGVANEESTALNDLANGIPSDIYKLTVDIVQED